MFVEIGCLIGGVPIGYALRNRPGIIQLTDQTLTWSVRILLFLLGLALGANDDLMARLDNLGLRGGIISVCCVVGSLIGVRFLEPCMNRHTRRHTEEDS